MRSIRKEDPEGKLIKQFNLESLNNFCLAGERCDVPTFKWIQQHFKMLINDNYWQTETGWPMCSNFRNLHTFPIKAGSAIKPVPGYNLKILKENFEEI
jgi:propionyl-CoA synthetase